MGFEILGYNRNYRVGGLVCGGDSGGGVAVCVEFDNNLTLCRCLRLSAALGGALRGSAARGNLSSQGRRGTKATPAAAATPAAEAAAAVERMAVNGQARKHQRSQ